MGTEVGRNVPTPLMILPASHESSEQSCVEEFPEFIPHVRAVEEEKCSSSDLRGSDVPGWGSGTPPQTQRRLKRCNSQQPPGAAAPGSTGPGCAGPGRLASCSH